MIRAALAWVQREHSTWTRADLMKVLGWSLGPGFAHLDPEARQELLLELTDGALSPDFGVRCLEAPEWPPVPQSLRREMDGRSVYTAPGTERYATRGQLSMEEALCQRAQRPGAPGTRRGSRAAQRRREHAGRGADPAEAELDAREPVAVLADCLDREVGEDSATEYQRRSMARADHLGLLHARWADQVKAADRERYQRIVHEALPQEWRGQLSPQATWLYRTLQAAELAGLDSAEITQTAIRSRSLDGARDVASVLDARLRAMVEPSCRCR